MKIFDKLDNMRIFHIFDVKERGYGATSICRRVLMFGTDSDADEVKGTETYRKDQDCKVCFKKAGLRLEPMSPTATGKEVRE